MAARTPKIKLKDLESFQFQRKMVNITRKGIRKKARIRKQYSVFGKNLGTRAKLLLNSCADIKNVKQTKISVRSISLQNLQQI